MFTLDLNKLNPDDDILFYTLKMLRVKKHPQSMNFGFSSFVTILVNRKKGTAPPPESL